ncbi:MAG TPA: sigma-70 family RNA polymerase sigma factor [Pseudorhodoferax sp.]|nr:sigma-70 family RNA polymerase sigma factor [Pseudorhodoferax sp.]
MVARYYKDLLRFCSQNVKDTDAARDVVQETYVRFLSAQQRGASAALQPGAVLHQIAKRLLIDRYRRAAVRRHENIDELQEFEQPAAPRHCQPEEALGSMQIIRAYVGAIEALPARCREAFVLRVFDEMSHAQIAEKMGISCSMVEKHVVRAMVACKQCERSLLAAAAAVPGRSAR